MPWGGLASGCLCAGAEGGHPPVTRSRTAIIEWRARPVIDPPGLLSQGYRLLSIIRIDGAPGRPGQGGGYDLVRKPCVSAPAGESPARQACPAAETLFRWPVRSQRSAWVGS